MVRKTQVFVVYYCVALVKQQAVHSGCS